MAVADLLAEGLRGKSAFFEGLMKELRDFTSQKACLVRLFSARVRLVQAFPASSGFPTEDCRVYRVYLGVYYT